MLIFVKIHRIFEKMQIIVKVELLELSEWSCEWPSELFIIKFPTVFKLFQHRVNASSYFATVTFLTVQNVPASCQRSKRKMNKLPAG